jgi:hypothetical protein
MPHDSFYRLLADAPPPLPRYYSYTYGSQWPTPNCVNETATPSSSTQDREEHREVPTSPQVPPTLQLADGEVRTIGILNIYLLVNVCVDIMYCGPTLIVTTND